jgi:four helix bundle protein
LAIRTFRDLHVYEEAYQAALVVSKLSKGFPKVEQVELARQLRRAARSLPANIAEGWAKRDSPSEFKRYLQVAIGSCQETQVWLEMSRDEKYISEEEYKESWTRYDRIGIMLHRLWKQWRSSEKEAVLSS